MPDHLEVAAEERVVADVEANDGCITAARRVSEVSTSGLRIEGVYVQSDIGFGQVMAEDELPRSV